jgi:hypothetical protein
VLIRNEGAAAAAMEGWTLSDAAETEFTFPPFSLAPGAQVRVWVKAGTNDGENLYWGRGSPVWNNTGGDTATLRDAAGRLVSEYSYE